MLIERDAVISKLHGAKEYIQRSYDCEIAGIAVNGLLIAAIDAVVPAIESMPTEPKVNRAEIMRLCNDIEDEVTDIAFNSTHYHIRDCCQAIRKYLELIGKELNGDAET